MNRNTLLIAVVLATVIPSVAYVFVNRYELVALSTLPGALVLDKWTGNVRMTSGDR